MAHADSSPINATEQATLAVKQISRVSLFESFWEQTPWDELAFPTVRWALEHHRQVGDQLAFMPDLRVRGPAWE